MESPAVMMVLIESDWNLKENGELKHDIFKDVLIESDWNLKEADAPGLPGQIQY